LPIFKGALMKETIEAGKVRHTGLEKHQKEIISRERKLGKKNMPCRELWGKAKI